MAHFRVTWEIDIEDVEDFHAAAVKALAMQRDPESTAVSFMVEKSGPLSTVEILSGAYRQEVDLLDKWQMAHNTDRSGDGTIPVIGYPEAADAHNWHVATDAELDAYEAYWNAKAGA